MDIYLKSGLTLLVFLLTIFEVYSRRGYNNKPPDPTKIRVVSIETAPYLISTQDSYGRVEYKGYVKSLLDFLAAAIGVRYELYVVPDDQYGYLQDGKTWNGMIKELLDNNADLAAAPLHKTPTRAKVVDFTRSVMNISATMLVHKTDKNSPIIQSVSDLEYYPKLSVGTLKTGTIRRSFVTSSDPEFINLWSRIKNTQPSAFTSSNADGIQRVRESGGNYIYIMPSDIATYNAGEMPCNLVTVGEFFQRNLAFAVQKGSNLLPRINKEIHKLENSGYFKELYTEWWLQNRPCTSFTNSRYLHHSGNTTSALSLSNLPLILCLTLTFVLNFVIRNV